MVVLKELIFNSVYLRGCGILKELTFINFHLGVCGGIPKCVL